jgi:hypothetical protein
MSAAQLRDTGNLDQHRHQTSSTTRNKIAGPPVRSYTRNLITSPTFRPLAEPDSGSSTKEISMILTVANISPIAALVAGILILILPNLLNYVVAIYLILIGLVGLNDIYHFIS